MSKLKIIFDATIVTNIFYKDDNRSGIFFVGLNLLKEFLKRDDVNLFIYVNPERYADGARLSREYFPKCDYLQDYSDYGLISRFYIKIKLGYNHYRKNNLIRKFFTLMLKVLHLYFRSTAKFDEKKIADADVYFSPVFCVPNIIRKYPNIRTFVFLYDAIPFLYPEFYPNGASHITQIMKTFREGDFFFCDSKSAQEDYKKLFPVVTSSNSCVVPLAANSTFTRIEDLSQIQCVKEKYGIPNDKKFVFSLCTLEPRKNLVRAVRSFLLFLKKNQIEDLIWVMGGAAWSSFSKVIEREGLVWNDKNLIHVGYVDDEDLPILYSGAEWFVYTSQYEGFGLPPLEAMQCGSPVITSNNSSLPEVVGDAGIMIDWDSDEQHIAAYEKYYFDEDLRRRKSFEGYERAKQFSWKKTVDLMLSFFQPK